MLNVFLFLLQVLVGDGEDKLCPFCVEGVEMNVAT